jgi:acyl-coenzyme A synthetase/AMP-(fatty) acid ligase
MFLPLCFGQKLVVVPESAIGDAERLIEIFESEGVTDVVLTPAMVKEIADWNTPIAARLHKLRTIALSGMALSPDLVQLVRRVLPKVRLLNAYAASEIGGAAIVSEIKGVSDLQGGGVPFPNTEVYILDENLDSASTGETGEIHVGAPHLSWGYLNQPGLTAERFLPNPFSSIPGSRMYRTGDLGRRIADGQIAVLGRTDDQVKVRGFRVELGEVETVLREHPLVRDAAVVANSDVAEDIRLIAYAVVGALEKVSTKSLRDFVTDRLPHYMVPSSWVVLNESLPRTALGKVDRQRLPVPDRFSIEAEFQAPRTAVEAAIAQIWTELLGIEQIGVHDSFLELGGHSLLAAQAIARIRGRLSVQMSPQEFLEHPTIAEQAQRVEGT